MVGRILGSRYRVVREIGTGGMGWVFEAEQLGLSRTVALKVLRNADARSLGRLRQEALTAGALRSPHVVAVFDFCAEPDEPPFLVMELLEGESLSSLLKRTRKLPPALAARIASHVLAGLDAAHQAGIVHRDVKPSNIWITRSLADDVVKLLDFGIVKSMQDDDAKGFATTVGSVLGTPSYVSPEQLRGMPVDARTDLHALGVVLHEMLTGRKPWVTETVALFKEILDRVPPHLSFLAPEVPTGLGDIVARALEKDPAARFQNAAEMLAALAPYAQGAGRSIPPPAPTRGMTAVMGPATQRVSNVPTTAPLEPPIVLPPPPRTPSFQPPPIASMTPAPAAVVPPSSPSGQVGRTLVSMPSYPPPRSSKPQVVSIPAAPPSTSRPARRSFAPFALGASLALAIVGVLGAVVHWLNARNATTAPDAAAAITTVTGAVRTAPDAAPRSR
ncbi:Serine/threonine protein kinase [Labilithrix luteola]|uniref:Serine/threonine protein kinase n=1 Tax=Labilithrix luteola TaxID=1391654 RepID=A0A0K1PT71_9BACT|nr:serine/threonine-protein kinase [Labilithrix luteola]AKU96730.1 Serine/threonine protein kinase [Labilithrix luteola]